MTHDPPCEHPPQAFTRITVERNVLLPDGTPHGSVAAYTLPSGAVSGDLIAAFAEIVTRLDQSTAEAIAERYGAAAGMDFLDRVAEATARWTEGPA